MRSAPVFGPESQLKYLSRLTSFTRDPYHMNLSMASDTPDSSRFGDIAVITFMVVQALDGVLTYLGVHIWGPSVEANPLISSAVSFAGVGTGVAIAKLFAVGLGMILHLRRVHGVVALLTAFYLAVAIVPWAMLFLSL
jgi:hypothetical protein